MKILENPLPCNQESEIKTSKISWFYDDSSDLIEINIETLEETEHKLFSLTWDERICIYQLPGNKLFCYRNVRWSDLESGTHFIINANYDIQILPKGKRRFRCFGTYYKDSVYIFGGSIVERIDLVILLVLVIIYLQNN